MRVLKTSCFACHRFENWCSLRPAKMLACDHWKLLVSLGIDFKIYAQYVPEKCNPDTRTKLISQKISVLNNKTENLVNAKCNDDHQMFFFSKKNNKIMWKMSAQKLHFAECEIFGKLHTFERCLTNQVLACKNETTFLTFSNKSNCREKEW